MPTTARKTKQNKQKKTLQCLKKRVRALYDSANYSPNSEETFQYNVFDIT